MMMMMMKMMMMMMMSASMMMMSASTCFQTPNSLFSSWAPAWPSTSCLQMKPSGRDRQLWPRGCAWTPSSARAASSAAKAHSTRPDQSNPPGAQCTTGHSWNCLPREHQQRGRRAQRGSLLDPTWVGMGLCGMCCPGPGAVSPDLGSPVAGTALMSSSPALCRPSGQAMMRFLAVW